MNIKKTLLSYIMSLHYLFGQGFWGSGFPEEKIKYSPRNYVCYKTGTPILIDGKIIDQGWENIDWTDSFVDIEGNLKPDPYLDTKTKMTWDDNYFYFCAYMEDPHVWATITARDAVIFKDNDFEIFLDPDGDTHNYYELEVNAFGTEWDLLLLKPYHDDNKVVIDSWDIPGLLTAVHVDGTINNPSDRDKGWSIEIAIPWKAFISNFRSNNPPKDGDQWKVNFSRVHWDVDIKDGKYIKKDTPEFNWVWSPQGLIYMHMPQFWGLVQFSDKVSGAEKVKFVKSDIDQIKWSLRQVYYRERNYFFRNNRYTASLKALNLMEKPVEGVPWPPEIVLTPSGWEAFVTWKSNMVIIRKDGKVWVQ